MSQALKQPLPGLPAQMKMAPEGRSAINKTVARANLEQAKKAAVLCLFYPKNNEPHFILTKRVAYVGVHSAQISFPGGQIEFDESPLNAALRETYEEVGIRVNEEAVISNITDIYIPVSNFYVYPFIASLKKQPHFKPDKTEVDYIIEVPVSELTNTLNHKQKQLDYSYGKFNAPYFYLRNETVWGATAMILREVFEILQLK